MIQNDLHLGDIVLFRHIGFFTFETFFYYGYNTPTYFNGEMKLEPIRYGEYITSRHYEQDQISVKAMSAIPPSLSFNKLQRRQRSCYIDFSHTLAHAFLCTFLNNSDVSNGTLTLIVGN